MPKRVAIIDIGSNSARVVIFQRTSRFGFHLIAQHKANVRISEGSFNHNGTLQDTAIQRAINSLKIFKKIINEYKAKKVLTVATAAVRNAPNRYEFLSKVKKETGLKIKVIDGQKEAYYGAVATKNLLPIKKSSITIDIGGGSTDMALIENNKIVDTISLNIGTITIKELFLDKGLPLEDAIEFINKEFEKIPHYFKAQEAIAIGGVLRAFAKSIMEISNYSYKKLHAFEYDISKYKKHIINILNANSHKELKELKIKENRYDTIKSGILIFSKLLEKLDINNVITSGVGVREGVFLHDMLRGVGGQFPKELNPSVVSIKDRLDILKLPIRNKIKIAKTLYSVLKYEINEKYYKELIDALNLSNIGKTLTIYDEHKHTYYIASHELNWKYTHKQMLLIAAILRSKGDKLMYKGIKKEHKKLLPPKRDLKWLGLIYTVSDLLYSYAPNDTFEFEYNDKILLIKTSCELQLFKDDLKNLRLPKDLKIKIAQ